MSTTSTDIINASRDNDVLNRMVAIASTLDTPRSQGEIEMARVRLASAPVDNDGNTVASVFAYALASYKPTPAPGADESKLTDAHIKYALNSVFSDS